MNKPYLTCITSLAASQCSTRSTGSPFSVPNLEKMCGLARPRTQSPIEVFLISDEAVFFLLDSTWIHSYLNVLFVTKRLHELNTTRIMGFRRGNLWEHLYPRM